MELCDANGIALFLWNYIHYGSGITLHEWNYVTLVELCYHTLMKLYCVNGSTVCYIGRITLTKSLCYVNEIMFTELHYIMLVELC